MAKYFGTDGIRGEVGNSTITAEFMQKLGNAVGSLINDKGYPKFVVIGQDTRSSGRLLKFALVSGLNAALDAKYTVHGPGAVSGYMYTAITRVPSFSRYRSGL